MLTCQVCSNPFEFDPNKQSAKTCSSSCSKVWRKTWRAEKCKIKAARKRPIRLCRHCEGQIRIHGRNVFCSAECKTANYVALHPPRIKKEKLPPRPPRPSYAHLSPEENKERLRAKGREYQRLFRLNNPEKNKEKRRKERENRLPRRSEINARQKSRKEMAFAALEALESMGISF